MGQPITASHLSEIVQSYESFVLLSHARPDGDAIGSVVALKAVLEELGKKAVGLISKTTTLHVHHGFLYIFLPFLHGYDVNMPNFAFYGGRT